LFWVPKLTLNKSQQKLKHKTNRFAEHQFNLEPLKLHLLALLGTNSQKPNNSLQKLEAVVMG